MTHKAFVRKGLHFSKRGIKRKKNCGRPLFFMSYMEVQDYSVGILKFGSGTVNYIPIAFKYISFPLIYKTNSQTSTNVYMP